MRNVRDTRSDGAESVFPPRSGHWSPDTGSPRRKGWRRSSSTAGRRERDGMRAVLARATVLAGAFTAGAVAARAATIPHLRRLTADLQRSRERILASREEERRQLRHDLHDGLGPTLASLAMSLDAARITLAGEPERMDPLLAEVRDRLATAVGEIRDLAHGLRPPALDDLGLVAAIESFAEGCCERVDVRF
ncbi:MAG: hypothetical protein HOU01_05810, partial [Streptomycetaceae bacterium]|nr:hypothetical protein [Streptomycetaceae bacterium]